MRYYQDKCGKVYVDRGMGFVPLGAALLTPRLTTEVAERAQVPVPRRAGAGEPSLCSANEYSDNEPTDDGGCVSQRCCRISQVWDGINWVNKESCRYAEKENVRNACKDVEDVNPNPGIITPTDAPEYKWAFTSYWQ